MRGNKRTSELESLVYKGRFPCSKLAPDAAMATPASRKQALASASRAPASLCPAVPPSLLSPSACAPSARLATESASPHAETLGPACLYEIQRYIWNDRKMGAVRWLTPAF